MIDFSKIECVGCTACASICPKSVIKMKNDKEGFLHPSIDNPEKCIECGLCEKACPVLNNKPEEKREDQAYIVQNTDKQIRKESASGGMFSAIAISVLRNNGIVYGAAYDDNFFVKHIAVKDEKELWRLRNSKYVQSNLTDVFRDVKKNLNAGYQVCFSGTPCQIEGLKCFLGKEYNNLLLVDIVCHGVSSPLIWEKYVKAIQKYNPSRIYFRWKHYGYKYSTMSVFDQSGNEVYYAGVDSDKMLRAYFTNNCDRESCYNCKFKKRYRVSDITMWDCFQPGYFDKGFDDDLGTSCVLINSAKGKTQFEIIKKLNLLKILPVDAEKLTFGNREMIGSVKRGDYRDSILLDAGCMEPKELFEKYFPDSPKQQANKILRLILVKSGCYSLIKKTIYTYRRLRTKK